MNSNLNNMSSGPAMNSSSNLTNPYSSSGFNNRPMANDNWQQNANASASTWHSANPLVMNNQLPAPTVTQISSSTSNNNFSSLDNLDPFGGANKQKTNTQANTFTLQKPTVDYIYPTGYNSAAAGLKTNANTPLMGSGSGNGVSAMNAVGMNSTMTPLMMPQSMNSVSQSQDNSNFNALSQQDILSFLN